MNARRATATRCLWLLLGITGCEKWSDGRSENVEAGARTEPEVASAVEDVLLAPTSVASALGDTHSWRVGLPEGDDAPSARRLFRVPVGPRGVRYATQDELKGPGGCAVAEHGGFWLIDGQPPGLPPRLLRLTRQGQIRGRIDLPEQARGLSVIHEHQGVVWGVARGGRERGVSQLVQVRGRDGKEVAVIPLSASQATHARGVLVQPDGQLVLSSGRTWTPIPALAPEPPEAREADWHDPVVAGGAFQIGSKQIRRQGQWSIDAKVGLRFRQLIQLGGRGELFMSAYNERFDDLVIRIDGQGGLAVAYGHAQHADMDQPFCVSRKGEVYELVSFPDRVELMQHRMRPLARDD